MAKAPVRRRARPRAPINQSRAAGAPAPASAATTAPRPGPMYDPEGDSRAGRSENELMAAANAARYDPDEDRRREHIDAVASGAVQANDGATMDVRVAKQILGEPDAPISDREQLALDIERIRGLKRTHGGATQKLALPKRSGYHTHWFNDEGGRIDDALSNGWSHRLDREKRPIRRAVGTGRDKGVQYAFAMDLPEVFWLEDMEARHAVAAARMDALKAQPFMARKGQAQSSDRGKFYDPSETGEVLKVEKANPTTPL